MSPNRHLPNDIARIVITRDPTLVWRALLGVTIVVCGLSVAGNVFLGAMLMDYSRLREAKEEAVQSSSSAIEAKTLAENALGARDAKIAELATKVSACESTLTASRTAKDLVERALVAATASPSDLPLLSTKAVLQRFGPFRVQAAVSRDAAAAGIREGAVALHSIAAARPRGFSPDESAAVAIILRISGTSQANGRGFWVVEAALTEPWRVPGTDASYRVIVHSEAEIVTTEGTAVERGVLDAVERVTAELLENIVNAKSDK